MVNKNLLLIDKYKANNSPIIGVVIYKNETSLQEQIKEALMKYFNCTIKNLKYEINDKSDIFNGFFTMINDKEQIEMDFEIHRIDMF